MTVLNQLFGPDPITSAVFLVLVSLTAVLLLICARIIFDLMHNIMQQSRQHKTNKRGV
jgi:nitrogen fixation/metabolism regulation signal transduction histidine kinase